MEKIQIICESPISGKETIVEVPLEGYNKWINGELIQIAMPELTPSEREVLVFGLTFEEQEQLFGL